MRKLTFDRNRLLLVIASLGLGVACDKEVIKDDTGSTVDPEDVCAYADMGWSLEVVLECDELELGVGQVGFCYEEEDPLVVDVEPIALRSSTAGIDLGYCLSSDDAFVMIGGLSGNTQLSHGALSNTATIEFLSGAGYDTLTSADGTMPCFGATVVLEGGSSLSGGSTFMERSFYWKGGDDPAEAEQEFGSSPGGISADGDEIEMPEPTLSWYGLDVELSLPSPLELPNTGVDHFATPVDDDGGC